MTEAKKSPAKKRATRSTPAKPTTETKSKRGRPAGGALEPVSMAVLARTFKLGRTTVSHRIKEAGVQPAGERYGLPVYPVAEAARAIVLAESDGSKGRDKDPDQMSPRVRLDHYKAEQERLKLEEHAGRLIPREEVYLGFSYAFKTVVEWLSVLPDALERDHGLDALMVERVRTAVDELRSSIHDRLLEEPADDPETVVAMLRVWVAYLDRHEVDAKVQRQLRNLVDSLGFEEVEVSGDAEAEVGE